MDAKTTSADGCEAIDPEEMKDTPWDRWAQAAHAAHLAHHLSHRPPVDDAGPPPPWKDMDMDQRLLYFSMSAAVHTQMLRDRQKEPPMPDRDSIAALAMSGTAAGLMLSGLLSGNFGRAHPWLAAFMAPAGAVAGVYAAFALEDRQTWLQRVDRVLGILSMFRTRRPAPAPEAGA